ncbi:MAG: S1 family peptidase [Pyrinomonadaceae bacterium]
MKRHLLGVAISVVVMLLLAPQCRADKTPTARIKPEDHTVSLDLKFTKKSPNAMQRVFSFLDYGPNGFATGFVVGNGLVMTAYHAVSGNLTVSKKVQLGFAPGDELAVEISVKGCRATVIRVDEDADLALLQVCQSGRQVRSPAFQAILSKDEKLFVIARPHGNKMVRRGVFYGPFVVKGAEFRLAKIDGHDGYSGSPVYNQKAEIVGVFSGYDGGHKLAMISPGIRAQKLLEDYVAGPKR